MKKLFDELKINRMMLANRFVRSATWEGMCKDDGRPTADLASYYANLAKGGVGLIITGYTFVRPDGKQLPGQMGISGEFSAEMRALTGAVHEAGGKICMQLVHAGGQTRPEIIGGKPLAPSAIKVAQFPQEPAALSAQQIEDIAAAFAQAAAKAREYGFDAVQLHASHGYLINQFLSPLTNRRDDTYGGSIENRCRFLLQCYDSVRKAVGGDFPVLVKLNGDDNLAGGLTLDDALVAARALDEAGIDAIEVSGGTPASGDRTPVRQAIATREQEAYNLPLAYRIKEAVSCPVMVVGGLRSYEIVEGIIRRGEADYVSMARPFIREPWLVNRWAKGDESRATCISCNGCFKPAMTEGRIYCVVDQIERDSVGTSL